MFLTGFDAKRLKKLYIGRVIKKHNLLQTLTRVNRTYKNYRYGYVVDFADISEEFKRTNEDYFRELQSELGDEMQHYTNLFKTEEEINVEIADIKEALFHFDTNNAEDRNSYSLSSDYTNLEVYLNSLLLNKDTDNDGVLNSDDLCKNTAYGVSVNENECEIPIVLHSHHN